MHLLRKLSAASLFAGMLLTVGAADAAAECNSASSCTRQLACLPGTQLVKDSNKVGYCQQTVPADTETPKCVGKGPLPKNWIWSSSYEHNNKKGMCITKDNKGNVNGTSPEAITCSSGYSFNSTTGLCTRAASTKYLRPTLSTSTSAAYAPTFCTTGASCKREVECSDSYNQIAAGSGYYCTKTVGGSTQTPKCVGKGPLPKNWIWSSSYEHNNKKGMCITKDNKGNVNDTSPEAITCSSGYSFNSAIGLCEKPGGTYFAEPILVAP